MTPPEIEAQVLRYYHAEKWTAGTIARQLHVHHSVVRRVLAQSGLPRIGVTARPSQIDPYLPLIRETLEKFPTLTASRLFAMVYERGYRGSPDHFRHLIALHRPRRPAEAYLRLRSLPGEQAQVDWGLCGARHSPHYAENRTMPSYWAPWRPALGLFGIFCTSLGIVLVRLKAPSGRRAARPVACTRLDCRHGQLSWQAFSLSWRDPLPNRRGWCPRIRDRARGQ